MLLIIFTKSSLVFCAMDFGMFSPQFCTPQLRFATQKKREYALAHPRFGIYCMFTLNSLKHHSTHRMTIATVASTHIIWGKEIRNTQITLEM